MLQNGGNRRIDAAAEAQIGAEIDPQHRQAHIGQVDAFIQAQVLVVLQDAHHGGKLLLHGIVLHSLPAGGLYPQQRMEIHDLNDCFNIHFCPPSERRPASSSIASGLRTANFCCFRVSSIMAPRRILSRMASPISSMFASSNTSRCSR